jgi:hypothetical protein
LGDLRGVTERTLKCLGSFEKLGDVKFAVERK